MQFFEDLSDVEAMLSFRRHQMQQNTATIFNIALLVIVLGGFAFFLYVQYNSNQVQQEEDKYKKIEFTPTPWLSATRNVRMEEYGSQLKPFEIETRYGLPGPSPGPSHGEVQ